MAVTVSGLYVQNIIDMADGTQLALNFALDTHRVALLSNSATPNFDTDVTWNTTNFVVFATPRQKWSSRQVLGSRYEPHSKR